MLGYNEKEMLGQFVWNFVRDEEISQQRVLGKMKGILPQQKVGNVSIVGKTRQYFQF